MRQLRRNRQLALFILICSFFFSGCSGFLARVSKTEKDPNVEEAGRLLLALKHQNRDLKTFKGVGRITLYQEGKKTQSNRIAWVGASPGRLRTVLSSASGQPFLSFASDGQWFYFFDHTQAQFHKQRASYSVMKKAFSVSIASDDIVSILTGRIPLQQYRSAVLLRDNHSQKGQTTSFPRRADTFHTGTSRESSSEYILVLRGSWGNIQEKVYFEDNKKDVHKIEVFELTGALAYRAELNMMQHANGYRIPATVVFSNDKGSGFKLDIERYWPQVQVTPSMFVLSPPDHDK